MEQECLQVVERVQTMYGHLARPSTVRAGDATGSFRDAVHHQNPDRAPVRPRLGGAVSNRSGPPLATPPVHTPPIWWQKPSVFLKAFSLVIAETRNQFAISDITRLTTDNARI
jgi:hypothetical protein